MLDRKHYWFMFPTKLHFPSSSLTAQNVLLLLYCTLEQHKQAFYVILGVCDIEKKYLNIFLDFFDNDN